MGRRCVEGVWIGCEGAKVGGEGEASVSLQRVGASGLVPVGESMCGGGMGVQGGQGGCEETFCVEGTRRGDLYVRGRRMSKK